MSAWDQAERCGQQVLSLILNAGELVPHVLHQPSNYGWTSYLVTSDSVRRAHVHIIDARESHKLWIMHCCIFPHLDDSSPIFGFDIICGPSRISGAFLDYSKTTDAEHSMIHWFDNRVNDLQWKKQRQLPDWATAIFSKSMVAAGAITDEQEINQLIDTGIDCLTHYLANVGKHRSIDVSSKDAQNYYCKNQKMNPHTPRTLLMLGLQESEVKEIFEDLMFPEY
jgi:hypothetical protein